VLVKEISERFNAEKDSGKKVKQYIADLKEEIAIAVEQNDAIQGSTSKSTAEKEESNNALVRTRKKIQEVRQKLKELRDAKAEAIRIAEAAAEEARNAAFVYELNDEEQIFYLQELGNAMAQAREGYEETGDVDELKKVQAEALDLAKDYRKSIRKEMKSLQKAFEKALEKTDADKINETRAAYFQSKAIVDYLQSLINQQIKADKEKAAALDAAKFGDTLSDYDQNKTLGKIEKFSNLTNAAGEVDEERVFNALADLETEAKTKYDKKQKNLDKLRKDPTDKQLKDLYFKRNMYNFISETLGPNSPAKVKKAETDRKAKYEATLRELTKTIGKARTLDEVMDALRYASKGSSELPDKLVGSKTDDTTKFVLENLEKEEFAELARSLA
jgi:hypothetical protein